jgi:hypothetical protein
MMPYVFISHSSLDKPFVRKLDATLSGHGVGVFLDERDIEVGDSIPAKIHEGLRHASHVINVMSSNSMKSKWVQEELDIAKMRRESSESCVILPVLIDDVEVPVGLSHIKYADFRAWQDTQSYIKAATSLLKALGVQLKPLYDAEVSYVLHHIDAFIAAEADMFWLSGYIDGALDTDQHIVRTESSPQEKWEVMGEVVRALLHRSGHRVTYSLPGLLKILKERDSNSVEGKLATVETLAVSLTELAAPRDRRTYYDYACAKNLMDTAIRLGGVLRDLHMEVFGVVAAGHIDKSRVGLIG